MRSLLPLLALLCFGCHQAQRKDGPPRQSLEALNKRLASLEDLEAKLAKRDDALQRERAMDLCMDILPALETREQRLKMADRGLKHAQALIKLRPKEPSGHYGWAVLTGRHMKDERLPDVGVVKKLKAAAEKSVDLDESYRHGAAFRYLGELYAKAPAWPVSIGDMDEAVFHFREAVRVAPNWPKNRLALAEALASEGEADEARAQIQQLDRLLAQENPKWCDYEAWSMRQRRERVLKSLPSADKP